MSINLYRSARWLQTFAQIMEVDRQRPLRAVPPRKPLFPAKLPVKSDAREDKS
ncbi:hypothetical protein [Thiolapillus sp.]